MATGHDEKNATRRGDPSTSGHSFSPATIELWQRYWSARDNASRNMLLLAYDALVYKAVRHLPAAVRANAEDDDLYSFGLFGLIDAIEKCDENADITRFPGYASYRIRGAIFDELRRLDWVPRSTRQRLIAYRTAADKLVGSLGRTPHHSEVCASLELDPVAGLVVLHEVAHARVISLTSTFDDTRDHGEERSVEDRSDGPEEFLLRAERRDDLLIALSQLTERQRTVIGHRFVGGLTQRQIAAMLGVTTARVCQIETAALRSLRRILRTEPLTTGWVTESAS